MAIGSKVKRARGAGVPLLAVASADQGAVVREVSQSINDNGGGAVISWDCIQGWVPLNEAGREAVNSLPGDPVEITGPFVESMRAARSSLPSGGTLLCLNAHLAMKDGGGWNLGSVQAVSNLRDLFKGDSRVLVLLAPDWNFGRELSESIIILDDDLPARSDLGAIIASLCEGAGVAVPVGDTFESAVDAVSGLSAFSAEQAVALSITGKGLSMPLLLERKRKQIENTRGLRVIPSKVNFALAGGCDGFKRDVAEIMNGPKSPRLIVWVDELEKSMSGAGGGDLSGVSSDQLGVLLDSMSRNDWVGQLLIGPAGCSKSWLCQSVVGQFSVMGIQLDLGGLKGSLVGESESNMRAAIRTIESIGGDRVMWLATCNEISQLKPELLRRFCAGSWFADLPDEVERGQIWAISLKRYGLACESSGEELVKRSEGWSGANIKDACYLASIKGCSVESSARGVVPAAKREAERIESLRKLSAGRFRSVSTGELYTVNLGGPTGSAAFAASARRVVTGGE